MIQGLLGQGQHNTLRAAELAQAPDSTNAQASNQQGSKRTRPDPLPAGRLSVISPEVYLTCPVPVVIMIWLGLPSCQLLLAADRPQDLLLHTQVTQRMGCPTSSASCSSNLTASATAVWPHAKHVSMQRFSHSTMSDVIFPPYKLWKLWSGLWKIRYPLSQQHFDMCLTKADSNGIR